MRSVQVLPEVLDDVSEAAAYYDEVGHAGLGDRFAGAFRGCLETIGKSGEVCRPVYQRFRKILIRPFPYLVFFADDREVWVVVLVIHGARSPRHIRGLAPEQLDQVAALILQLRRANDADRKEELAGMIDDPDVVPWKPSPRE